MCWTIRKGLTQVFQMQVALNAYLTLSCGVKNSVDLLAMWARVSSSRLAGTFDFRWLVQICSGLSAYCGILSRLSIETSLWLLIESGIAVKAKRSQVFPEHAFPKSSILSFLSISQWERRSRSWQWRLRWRGPYRTRLEDYWGFTAEWRKLIGFDGGGDQIWFYSGSQVRFEDLNIPTFLLFPRYFLGRFVFLSRFDTLVSTIFEHFNADNVRLRRPLRYLTESIKMLNIGLVVGLNKEGHAPEGEEVYSTVWNQTKQHESLPISSGIQH